MVKPKLYLLAKLTLYLIAKSNGLTQAKPNVKSNG